MAEAKKPVRNDSVLNTGITSAATRRAEERAQRQRDLRASQRASLTPGGEIIKAWIDQEIAEAADLTKIIIIADSEKNVRAQLLGRQYYIEALKRLKGKTNNILREVKVAEKQAAEEKSEAYKAFEREAAEK